MKTSRSWLLLALVLTAGCHHARGPENGGRIPPPPPASLPPPDAIAGVFTVRQKLVATSAHGGGSFEAVLEKVEGKLTLLGLTPYGSRAFLLEQNGPQVSFTSYIPKELPFPPTYMLLDVHRVFDAPLAPPLPEGEREGESHGAPVHEVWRAGKLVRRLYGEAGAPRGAAPVVTVSYEGEGPSGLAAHVTLTHHRFGYQLVVDTLPL